MYVPRDWPVCSFCPIDSKHPELCSPTTGRIPLHDSGSKQYFRKVIVFRLYCSVPSLSYWRDSQSISKIQINQPFTVLWWIDNPTVVPEEELVAAQLAFNLQEAPVISAEGTYLPSQKILPKFDISPMECPDKSIHSAEPRRPFSASCGAFHLEPI